LLIDIDSPKCPSKVSSSDAEKQSVLAHTEKIKQHLSDFAWPEPFQSDSGNGGHLIYTLPDLANTPENVDLLKRVLKGLAKFDTTEAKVDLTTFNPSRITKLYGTFARKGDNDIDNGRPHRQSKILHLPKEKVPVTIEQLNQIALLKDEPKQPERQEIRKGSDCPTINAESGKLDVEKYLNQYDREVSKTKQHGNSTLYILKKCVFDETHTANESAIGQTLNGMLFYQCFHDSCKNKTWKEARAIISGNDNLKPFMTGQTTENGYKESRQKEHVEVDDQGNRKQAESTECLQGGHTAYELSTMHFELSGLSMALYPQDLPF
jgi:hypothetical protein